MASASAHAIEIGESNSRAGSQAEVVRINCLKQGWCPCRPPINGLLLHIEIASQMIVIERRAFTAQFASVGEPNASGVAKGRQRNAVGQDKGGVTYCERIDCVVECIVMKPQIE